jgi:hypothetical protein
MTGLSNATSIEAERTNYTNSAPYDLTLKIKATNYIELFDTLDLRLPKPIYFTNETTCKGENYWTKGTIRCNISSDLRDVTLNLSINGRYNTYYRKL